MFNAEEIDLRCRVGGDLPTGPIAGRSNERPGASDTAIIRFRRIMLDAVRSFQAIGRGQPTIPHGKPRSLEDVMRETDDRRTPGVPADELTATSTIKAAE